MTLHAIEVGAPWTFQAPGCAARYYHVEAVESAGHLSDVVRLNNVDTGKCAHVTRHWMVIPRAIGRWTPGWEGRAS